MYVATTRARDHLVLSMRRPAKGQKTTAAVIAEYLENHAELWEAVELNEAAALPESRPAGEAESHVLDESLHSTEHLDR